MLTRDHIPRGTERNEPAAWRKCLEQDDSLSPGLRESYQRTLAGFERFCGQRQMGTAPGRETRAAAQPTVGLAREYVELQRLEQAPGPTQLQEWKDALNWLFRCGRRLGGERPSPGAASSELPDAPDFTAAPADSNIAAPGDGRAPAISLPPPLTHYPGVIKTR